MSSYINLSRDSNNKSQTPKAGNDPNSKQKQQQSESQSQQEENKMSSKSRKLTSSQLADLESPYEVRLSPSTKKVVYSLRSLWNRPRKEDRWVSSIWVADTSEQCSMRRVTDGEVYDGLPQWRPSKDGDDEGVIAFLSDRAKEGVNSIWMVDVNNADGVEPKALTSTENEKAISQFKWSGDGKFIAFLSVDEKTTEMKEKEKRKDDPMVYGEYWEFNRLRIVEVDTGKVTTLVARDYCHVYEFTWSPDSKRIAFVSQGLPEYEAHIESGSTIEIVQINGDGSSDNVETLETVPGYLGDLCWVGESLWFRSKYDMLFNNSSMAIYKMDLNEKKSRWYAYGEENCASSWAFPPALVRVSDTELIAQVQSGLHDQFHMVVEGKKLFDEMTEIRGWDTKFNKAGELVLVIVNSTAEKPYEIYSIIEDQKMCLTEHGKEVAELKLAVAEPFYAKSRDGTELDAVLIVPKNYDAPKPWPTIVCPHGGPYTRVSIGFDQPNFQWSPWFASLGFVVLCPNYRGGSSHGESHAASARENAGGYVYTDTIDITKAAVEAGIVDPNRVGIAGWSYGGIISYLAVTHDSEFHFQAAMCGAGDTDWDACIMTTIGWRTAIQVAGRAPWVVDIKDTHNREHSALWHMQDIKTPILILHGEDDPVVPISQAKAFHYGCLHYKVPCELVIYPREGHGIFPPLERAHFVDMLERMGRFFGKYLLGQSP